MLQAHHGIDGDRFVASKSQLLLADAITDRVQVADQQPHRAGYDAMMIKKALYNAIGYY
ncbi:hypothetical protein D3C75_1006880 [compost metagenome]